MTKNIFLLLIAALTISTTFAQKRVVYRIDEFQKSPPETFDERNYEDSAVQIDGKDVNRRIVEESSNLSYAFTRFSNRFDFRPVNLDLKVFMTASVYCSSEGYIRYIVFELREFKYTGKRVVSEFYELPKPIENKFRRIFEEFAKQYKSSYKSLKPFKIRISINLKKGKSKKSEQTVNTLEEALATTLPDTVKEVNFSGLELSIIPDVIYRFKNLEELELSNNYFTSIPAEITKLKKLRYLGLNFNDLTNDSLSFTRNRNLKVLRLQHNPITTLPETVRKNRKLEDLLLGNNKLSDLKTASFRGLRKLKTLNLYNVQIESLPGTVKRMKHLEIIDLYHNDLRFLPDKFYKLKRLKTLAVAHNRLWKLPEKMYKHRKLTDLYIHHNKLSSLPQLPQALTLLHFNDNRFKDFPSEISLLLNVKSVDFSSNEIERLPAELLQLPNLTHVYMMGNEYNRKKELFDDVDRFVVDLERKKITVR